MRETGTSLLTAWMIILAVTGWCCQPVACCLPSPDTISVSGSATVLVRDCCKRRGSRDHDDSPSPAAPCHGEPICHGVCVYIHLQELLLVSVDATFITCSFEAVDSQVKGHCGQSGATHNLDHFRPAEPLYLLHQVFLI